MNISDFQSEFNKIKSRSHFSKAIHPEREKAFSQLLEIGLPTTKWEDWRYTDLSIIANNSFRLSDTQDMPSKKIDISDYQINGTDPIVIFNGHYQEDLSVIPDGVTLLPNLDYIEKNNWKFKNPTLSPFDLLNTTFMDSGVSLIIDSNVNIQKPIQLILISSGVDSLMVSPRLHIDVGQSSSATFIEEHVGTSNSFFQNTSLFISTGINAQLDHIRIQSNSDKMVNMANQYLYQNQDSHYTFFQFATGSKLGRLNLHAQLEGEGADCSLNGLTLSNKNQHIDNHIIIDHKVANCTSSQNFKTVLQDNSSGLFNGRTIVREGAQKTDSSQSNNNLLLSTNALMNSNPQLEIYADDVKCSHGSTTGALDTESLFYLQSRGLNSFTAKSLLIRGFVTELLEAIKNENIRKYITGKFSNWISKNTIS